MRTGAKKVRARLFSHTKTDFRDFRDTCPNHLLILKIGHGKTEYSLTIYITTKKNSATSDLEHALRSKNVHVRPFCILKRTLEIGQGKTKYTFTICLTTKRDMTVFFAGSIDGTYI